MPCVRRKADWALQWITDNKSTFGKEDATKKYTVNKIKQQLTRRCFTLICG